MNYREKIQSMVAQINKLYDDAEWLRDMATGEEKEYWNEHRGIFYNAAGPLRKLDDSLSQDRAKMCVHDKCYKKKEYVQCQVCNNSEVLTDVEECEHCGKHWYDYSICKKCE